ncbi:MAG: hypothetical protein JWO91_349, partial [Acidobacteriaceae bacterium]|nr:hypothetical protein [Acidobacteriaceae bacterium]
MNVNEVIHEALVLTNHELVEHEVALETDLAPDVPV